MEAAKRKKGSKRIKIESLTLPTVFTASHSEPQAEAWLTASSDAITDSITRATLRRQIRGRWANVSRYTPATYLQELRDYAMLYPELLRLDTIGRSHEGRPLAMLTMGSGPHPVYVLGAIHAREWLTTTHVMKTIEHLVGAHESGDRMGDFDVREMLDSCTIYFTPMINPDGVDIAQRGAAGRPAEFLSIPVAKSKVGYPSWKANGRGVDLNRNFAPGWENNNTSPDGPCSEQYKGEAPESEPETRAMIALMDSVKPEAIVSFHTQGEVLYMSQPDARARRIANAVEEYTGFVPQPIDPPYGSMQDDVDRRLGCLYVNVELCPAIGPFPYPDKLFFQRVWPRADMVVPIVAAGLYE